jgi:hypothetical protein
MLLVILKQYLFFLHKMGLNSDDNAEHMVKGFSVNGAKVIEH